MTRLLLLDSPGKRIILSGNEAIARGALEAGVRVAAAYPGNPCTEILEAIALVASERGIHAEWSTNEKVALEVAAGAALAGLRSMVSMKHVGLNWAMDPLMCLNLSGVRAGMVIVVGDDPESRASQNEQDSRFYTLLSELPMLEPSSPAEAKDMVVKAYEISEQLQLPVFLRSVQRLSHGLEDVALGPLPATQRQPRFVKDARFVVTGAGGASLRLHHALHAKKQLMQKVVETLPFNRLTTEGHAKIGVVASGLDYAFVLEGLQMLGKASEIAVLKIGTPHPLPLGKLEALCRAVETVLVVEEVEAFLELQIKAFVGERHLSCKVLGKELIPSVGEVETADVVNALHRLGVSNGDMQLPRLELEQELDGKLPTRTSTMCVGCPHRSTFFALRRAVFKTLKNKALFCGDIGCYSFGAQPPFRLMDVKFSMGAGLGVAQGLVTAGIETKIFALIGDSTFFHAGLPGLINAVYNNVNFVLVILDNLVVGQTGQQPDPGTGLTATGQAAKRIILEDVIKALGVESIHVVDALNVKQAEAAFRTAIAFPGPGPAVVIARGLCTLELLRQMQREEKKVAGYSVDQEKCTACGYCLDYLACPALGKQVDKKVQIDLGLCTGCSVCMQICPPRAILRVGA